MAQVLPPGRRDDGEQADPLSCLPWSCRACRFRAALRAAAAGLAGASASPPGDRPRRPPRSPRSRPAPAAAHGVPAVRSARPPGPDSRPARLIVTVGTSTCAWVQPGTTAAPPSEASSAAALAEARTGSSRSTSRSKRYDDSLNSRCRRLIRAVPRAEKCAASITRSRRGLRDLGRQPAHGAGHRDRPGVVGDQDVVGVEVADDVVERLQPLAGPAPGGPRSGRTARRRSNACIGWPSSIIR